MYILFINLVGYILFIIELEYKFMYILFINPSGKWDIFFFPTQFNNNSNKKNYKNTIQPMGSTRSM